MSSLSTPTGPPTGASPARRAGPAAPGGEPRAPRRPTRAPYLFLAPALVLAATFLLAPVVVALVLSTRAWTITGDGIGRRESVFVGLDNYAASLTDPGLWQGLGRLAVYGAVVVPIMLGLALLFALLLDSQRARFSRAARLLIFLPYAVPGVIATLLWGFQYLPTVGPLHDVAALLGLPAPDFLGERTVLLSVANIAIWGGVGFNMVVLYTSLRAVPGELYDAARVDGCSEVALALRIKVPLLLPALVMTGVFSLIATLQVYNEPTTLAPLANTISSDWVPLMKIYTDAFVENDIFSAAATSVVIAAGTLVVSLVALAALQGKVFGEER